MYSKHGFFIRTLRIMPIFSGDFLFIGLKPYESSLLSSSPKPFGMRMFRLITCSDTYLYNLFLYKMQLSKVRLISDVVIYAFEVHQGEIMHIGFNAASINNSIILVIMQTHKQTTIFHHFLKKS